MTPSSTAAITPTPEKRVPPLGTSTSGAPEEEPELSCPRNSHLAPPQGKTELPEQTDQQLESLIAWFEGMGRGHVGNPRPPKKGGRKSLREKIRQILPFPTGKAGLPQRGKTKKCEPRWIVLQCGCGKRAVKSGNCYAEDCIECAKGGKDGTKSSKSPTAKRRARGTIYRKPFVKWVKPDVAKMSPENRHRWELYGHKEWKEAADKAEKEAKTSPKDGIRRRPLATAIACVERGGVLHQLTCTQPVALQPLAGDPHWWLGTQRRMRYWMSKPPEPWDVEKAHDEGYTAGGFGLPWAFVTSHPAGDQLGLDVFRAHLMILGVFAPTLPPAPSAEDVDPTANCSCGSGRSYEACCLNPKLWRKGGGMINLVKMRRLWRKALQWPNDRELANPQHDFVDQRTRTKNRKGDFRAVLEHKIQYMFRPFPGWSWWRGKAVRHWGTVPWESEVVERPHCPVCGEVYCLVQITDHLPEGVAVLCHARGP